MLGDGLIYGTISHSLSFLQADLSRPVRGLECTVFSAKLDAELILRSPRRQRDPAGDRPIKLPFRFVSFCRFGLLSCKEFNLIAISYWFFFGDVGSLIGLGA